MNWLRRLLPAGRAEPEFVDRRPVLLGLDNPHSRRPDHALYPAPVGSAGYRLWVMLRALEPTLRRTHYASRFDRRNLCDYPAPLRQSYLRERFVALEDGLGGRTVVGLGVRVRDAMGLRGQPACTLHRLSGSSVLLAGWIPHPSGRNRWYNNPDNRRTVAEFLLGLAGERDDLQRE